MHTLQDSVDVLILQFELHSSHLCSSLLCLLHDGCFLPCLICNLWYLTHHPKCLHHHPKRLIHIIICGCSLLLGNIWLHHMLRCNCHIQLHGHLIIIQESHHKRNHKLKSLQMKMLLRWKMKRMMRKIWDSFYEFYNIWQTLLTIESLYLLNASLGYGICFIHAILFKYCVNFIRWSNSA